MAAKIFTVGDVLPATTQLRIIADIPNAGWDGQGGAYTTNQYLRVYTYDDSGSADYGFDVKINGSFLTLSNYNLSKLVNNEWVSCEDVEYNIMSVIIDTSTWTEIQRTIVNSTPPVYWEDLNAPQGYTITFNSNGGSTVTDLTEQTALPNPLPIPTKENHSFIAWYYDSDFTNEALAGDPLTGDVTLYAKWELNTYTITFEENGGSTISDIEEATELPTPLPMPVKPGYKFVAWYYDEELTTRAKAGDIIEANTTLYAKWHNVSSWLAEIANAIREKEGSEEPIKHIDFGDRITALPSPKPEETKTVIPNFASGNVVVTPTSGKVMTQVIINKDSNLIADNIKKDVTVHGITGTLEVGGAEMPSTAGGSIFTGATIPLTYKNNTHDYENNYEYKSATHNITITGLDGRATITGNGTKNVLVAFDVTSSTTSLKNFTITCVNGDQELTYKGLHAHYGETVTGILTFAYNNITHDGSEGTFDTSGLTANYKFIVTSSSVLPKFSTDTALWNTIYSHQLLNVLIGNFSGTSIDANFMRYCYSFNQPLTLPSGLSSIGNYFMYSCSAFNQPLTLPSGLSSIGNYFMYNCYAFNQPLTLPSELSSIGNNFMRYCYSFNQPLTLPSELSSIGDSFMLDCRAFNQPLTLPSGLSSIGNNFMSECRAFNQPLTLPSGLSSIGNYFMYNCYAFNQPLTLPSGLSSIGNYFMYNCYAFNQPLTLPSGLNSIGTNFMYNCYAFNQPLTLPSELSSIGNNFMRYCYSFNQPLTLPSGLNSIGDNFMCDCRAFNQPLTLPSGLNSIGDYFMNNCYSLSTIIWNVSVYPIDNNSLSQSVNTKTESTYGAGIKVYGTKRAELISALPNSTSSPFRKLINGGS
jgi:uncharacterized repeat protein (TIGR02543 family)